MGAILAELEDRNTKIFRLKKEGKTLAEIADAVGLSTSGVSKILHPKKGGKVSAKTGGNLHQNKVEKSVENPLEKEVETLRKTVETLVENFTMQAEGFEVEIAQQKEVYRLEFLRLQKVVEEAQKANDDLVQKLEELEVQKLVEMERANALELQLKKERSFGASVMRFLHSDALVNAVMLVVSCALALGVTSRIFIAAGVQEVASYIIALGIDIAAFIFLSKGVHWGGMVFAFLAGVQVIIVTGHGWIPENWQVVVKSIALGCMVIGMIYGFGYLIAKSKK